MSAAEGGALDAVLPTGTGGPGRPGVDAADGRTLYGLAVLRVAANGCGVAPRRLDGEPQAGAAADAGDGAGGDLPEAEHQQGTSGAQGSPVSVAGSGDRATEPGLVRRHHVYPNGQGFCVSGGGDGLVQPPGSGMAAVDSHGRRFLR